MLNIKAIDVVVMAFSCPLRYVDQLFYIRAEKNKQKGNKYFLYIRLILTYMYMYMLLYGDLNVSVEESH